MLPRMIERDLTTILTRAGRRFPAVTLTGPRQSGKSTLCREVFAKLPYANLEAPDVRAFATDDPRAFLAQYPKGAILDEVQRTPELPSYLQPRIDEDPRPGRWILTGSQNLALLESVSQSLAGRSAVLHLLPMSRGEVTRFKRHPQTLDDTLLAGGYPRIFDRKIPPADFLSSYVQTYIERDVRSIANVGDLVTFQRFLELCAGRTAQLINYSSLAADCGISQPTAKAWLSILETSFVVFRLPPYSGSTRKRIIKMPRLHFHDSGLACWLLGIRTTEQLHAHPLRGAIFESWVISEILKHRWNAGEARGLSFYRDRDAVEVDLIVDRGQKTLLVEIKASTTANASLFDSVTRARKKLESHDGDLAAIVVYGGHEPQNRTRARLMPWSALHQSRWS